ncbi:MAG: cytochrome c, partial [Alteraurantiacibacter sp.]|nr:cytochrome c [Alteraurantiacibacter sp.]
FQNWSCGACHALSHGGGFGQIGPSLDGNTGLDKAYIINRTTNGQGAMPSFGGQMTDAEIELLAAYIMQVKR